MTVRRAAVSIGVGGTAFLVAGAVGFEIFGVDFPSVFYVLPIALIAAIAAAAGAYLGLTSTPSRTVESGLVGAAALSYSSFLLWFVRYSIAATRGFLSFELIGLLGGVIAIGFAVAAWVSYPVFEG